MQFLSLYEHAAGTAADAHMDAAGVPIRPPYTARNVTVVGTAQAGWLSAHPGTTYVPGVSSLNYTGPGQTRAVLAFTQIGLDNQVGYTSKVDTDLVVDVVGLFSS